MTYGRRASDLTGPKPFAETLKLAFCDSTRPMRIVTVLIHFAIMVGFILRDLSPYDNDDLDYILTVFPTWVWVLMLAYVIFARVMGLFVWIGFKWSRRTTPMVAGFVYIELFISNCYAPEMGMALGYIVVILIEAHILARAYTEDQLGIL